jgi:hypothetical protein
VKLRHVPFLHLTGGDINAISLATTAHSEEDIELRESKTLVALRDGVECHRVVENVVIEGELSTIMRFDQ